MKRIFLLTFMLMTGQIVADCQQITQGGGNS